MDLRHMRHFVAVAEEMHFGRAAKRLNMAQPPLSQSIRRLEIDLGVDLFNRSRRNVELTDAGRVFLDEARRTLMQADLACKLAQREAVKVPEVRVSFVGPALYRVLPDLLVQYRADTPDVHVRLLERSSPEQIDGILAGDFDVGFVTGSATIGRPCESLIVERATFVAAVPAAWDLGREGPISLRELSESPFIAPPQHYAPLSMESSAIFKDVGVMPHVAQEATQTNTAISLVAAGLGCSLVMATAAATRVHGVRFVPLSDAPASACWEMAMAWHPRRLDGVAAHFVAFATGYVRDRPELTAPRPRVSGEMEPAILAAEIE